MKPSRIRSFAAMAALTAAMALSAAVSGCEGGTSSETVGFVEAGPDGSRISGRTDPGISVGLYAADFLPLSDSGFASLAVADSSGSFAFDNLLPGKYRLLARKDSGRKAGLIPEIELPGRPGTLLRAALEPTGTLSGSIPDSLPAFLGYVYVPGTNLFAQADSRMRYTLPGMPAGSYPVIKVWRRTLSCEPDRACGGSESRRDSAEVRIEPGQDAIW